MGEHCKFINIPSINHLIKCLFVIASFTLSAPAFANANACYIKILAGDYDQALCTKDVKQGMADSRYSLGLVYEHGRGTRINYQQAFYWYNLAAEQGHAEAQLNLGNLYNNGKGIPQSYKQAAYWYTKAAEQGYDKAQYNMGNMYAYARGTPEDYKQAVYWYTKAAEQGYAEAQLELGNKYYYGQGILKDSVLAYVWWHIAAAQGHENAAKNKGVLEQNMTPDQISKAETLSKEYFAKYVITLVTLN
jgi:TPR repeat protein